MNYETILYRTEGAVGIIMLNRPERMNAVIEEMYREIQDVLSSAGNDKSVRALLLTGSAFMKNGSEKQAFCAGADLKKHSSGERTKSAQRDYIMLAHQTVRTIYEFPKPVIAAVNGPARGAGAEMALSCDFIFMAHSATIGFPEIGIGTFVGGGTTRLLPELVGMARAKELVYTGMIVDGEKAVSLGLALRSFPVNRLLEEAVAFAVGLSEKAPVSMVQAKKLLQNSPGRDIESVLNLEAEAILQCMDTEDWSEGIQSFIEKRKPVFKGR